VTNNPDRITRLVDHLFRKESGKLNAILARIFGFEHIELVEDIVQDTFITALRRWSHGSVPDNPSAWLMQVAKNKIRNALKRQNRSVRLDDRQAGTPAGQQEGLDRLFLDHEIRDSQLRVLFACCNPEFSEKAQIMLTLKTLSGFSISEIAGALLMKEEAVKKALYRTRKSIRRDDLEFSIPFLDQAAERLQSVHTVLYLMFNEGYKRTGGDELIKESLCYEATRLVRLLIDTLPDERSDSYALLSLFCFNSSRFNARVDAEGEIVDLRKQDRASWDHDLIRLGFHFLALSRRSDTLSRYHLEAGIAAAHCAASSWEETDWNSILYYYDRLLEMTDNPVVRINRAIAVSNLHGPEEGLEALSQLDDTLPVEDYYLYHATVADMHYRLRHFDLARSYYRVASEMTDSQPEKRFLAKRIDRCNTRNITDN